MRSLARASQLLLIRKVSFSVIVLGAAMRVAVSCEATHRDALRLERYELAARHLAAAAQEPRLRDLGSADAIGMALDWLARSLSIRISSGLRS
jgi:isopentenyl diphosphate isomerase/L-lactate dehydrogenase-like FMN-dependent dehydrogenase